MQSEAKGGHTMKRFEKETLLKLLLLVSIITIAIIGLYALSLIFSGLIDNVSTAAISVIMPFSIAFLISFIIHPLANIFRDRIGIPETLAIILAITVGILGLLGVITITVVFITSQIGNILSSLVNFIDNEAIENLIEAALAAINDYLDRSDIIAIIENFQEEGLSLEPLGELITTVFSTLASAATSVVSATFTIILTPVFMYYLIKDRNKVFRGIGRVFPPNIRPHAKALAVRSDAVIRSYLKGQGLVMIFIATFFIITYSILSFFIPDFHLWHAIFFAVIMGLFSIIPYLGVWISIAAPVVLLLTLHLEHGEDTWIYIIGIAMIFILNIIEEIIESAFIQPNVFSRQVRIHPLAVLASFLFFGGIFGLVGVILAVPIAGTIKVTFIYFKSLNQDTASSSDTP